MNPVFLTPLVVASALFLENMDSTVIATSLPAIAVDLGVDAILLKLAFTSYLLSLAVFIPASGWAADRFGARLVFRIAIMVFTAGSLFCAFTGSFAGFIAARAIQGLGGAMMVPVGRLVILRTIPKSDLVRALSFLTIPALIGPIVGPIIGGFITTYFHWRWIFWINLPFGLLAVGLATRYLPDPKVETPPPLDALGLLLSGFGLSVLIFGLTIFGRDLVPNWAIVALLGSAIFALFFYIRHAGKVADPIIDLSLLNILTFRTSVLGGFLFRTGVGAVPFLLPLMLQLGFGLTPFASGSLTFAAAAGAMLLKFAAPPILKKFGFRKVLVSNALVSAAFLASTALFTPHTSHIVILLVLFIGGFFRSLQFTSLNAIAYADIGPDQISRATSFSSVVQQLSGSVGVALAAMVLELAQWQHGGQSLRIQDFGLAFIFVAGLSALSALSHRELPKRRRL